MYMLVWESPHAGAAVPLAAVSQGGFRFWGFAWQLVLVCILRIFLQRRLLSRGCIRGAQDLIEARSPVRIASDSAGRSV